MNVYAAYKFNQLDDNDYTKAAGVATDDRRPWVSFTSSNLQYTPS